MFRRGSTEPFRYMRRRCTRKRLVMSQRRYEGACNRIADANVTFCDEGGAKGIGRMFFCTEKRSKANFAPTCGFRVHYRCRHFFIYSMLIIHCPVFLEPSRSSTPISLRASISLFIVLELTPIFFAMSSINTFLVSAMIVTICIAHSIFF